MRVAFANTGLRSISLLLVVCSALCVALLSMPTHADESDLGLELLPWSKKVADHRYESQRDYEGTVKFYKDKLKGQKQVRFYKEVSLPTVKYVHIENTSPTSGWSGINISVVNGRVRYFILDRRAASKANAPGASPSSTKPAPKSSAKPSGSKPSGTEPR